MKYAKLWKGMDPHVRSLWRCLTEPSVTLQDIALRRKARVLAGFLLILFVLFGTLDIIYYLHPDYTNSSQSIVGYLLLTVAYTLTRKGRYGPAAALTLAMFPIVLFSEVISNSSNDPVVTLNFLVLSLLLASILLSLRGTMIMAGVVIGGILLMPILAQEAIADFSTVLGPLAVNGIGAALVIVAMIHRDQIEGDRRAELSQINQKLRAQIAERQQIEDALRESEVRFRSLVEQSSDGIVLIDEHGAIIEWNRGQEEITGFQKADVLGRDVWDVQFQLGDEEKLGLAFFQQIRAEIQEFLQTGQAAWLNQLSDVVLHRDDGTVREIQSVVFPIKTSKGFMAGSISRDISAQKGTEQALRQSEERHRAIAEMISDYAYAYRVDPDGTFKSEWITGDAYQRITGYQAGEISDTLDLYHPEDRDTVHRDVEAVIAGEPSSGEYRIITKSGDERWLLIHRHPVWDKEEKRVIRFYGAARDITERKKAEEALRKSEERFYKSFQTSPDSVTISRLDDGTFIHVNAGFTHLTGYTQEEVVGKSSLEVQVWIDPDLRERLTQELQKRGAVSNLEGEFRRKDGSVAVALLSARVIEIDGQTCLLSITRDITERKRAEAEREALIEELELKNAELERFTYTVSHDLKSPLITIQGFLGFLEQAARVGDIEQVEQDMSRISNAVGKMQQLMDELLELSRIGRLVNPPEELPFGKLAQQALDMVEGELSEHGIVVDIANDLPVVYGDKVRLQEALGNLLSNAAKFMGDQPDPRITIGLRHDGEGPVFYVQDNGVGIEPRYHDTVFGLFNKLTNQSEGTGIGLAIVKRIIEVHGGRIWVESAGNGLGSTFCFTLPDNEGNPQWKATRQTASH